MSKREAATLHGALWRFHWEVCGMWHSMACSRTGLQRLHQRAVLRCAVAGGS